MPEEALSYTFVVFLVGCVVLANTYVKSALSRTSVPALVGYLAIGILLRTGDHLGGLFGPVSLEILGFLGKVGLVLLLFRVGLESDLEGLLKQLRRASLVWVADVAVSGLLGFVAAFYLLGLSWVSALTVATAFTATSVGITVAVWERSGALKTPNGELLVDVAELDDISAVVLMALLFSILGALNASGGVDPLRTVPWVVGGFMLKLAGFGAFCFVFARYAERPLSDAFRRSSSPPDHMLVVVSVGFLIAALADVLGFSLAIGAFFAGLVFSRDPDAVRDEASFDPLYELFSPFFFIGVGLEVDPAGLASAVGPGLALLAFAVASKVLADGIPVWMLAGPRDALLIGASMVPRAEIAMVILQRGLAMGEGVISREIFSAMVMVSALTCLLAPIAVGQLLQHRPRGSA